MLNIFTLKRLCNVFNYLIDLVSFTEFKTNYINEKINKSLFNFTYLYGNADI